MFTFTVPFNGKECIIKFALMPNDFEIFDYPINVQRKVVYNKRSFIYIEN